MPSFQIMMTYHRPFFLIKWRHCVRQTPILALSFSFSLPTQDFCIGYSSDTIVINDRLNDWFTPIPFWLEPDSLEPLLKAICTYFSESKKKIRLPKLPPPCHLCLEYYANIRNSYEYGKVQNLDSKLKYKKSSKEICESQVVIAYASKIMLFRSQCFEVALKFGWGTYSECTKIWLRHVIEVSWLSYMCYHMTNLHRSLFALKSGPHRTIAMPDFYHYSILKYTVLPSKIYIQIKKQAAMMAQKPISRSGTGSISASGFLPAQVCKLVLSSTTNSNEVAPNAVIQLNKNNNRNEEQTTTEVRNSMNLIDPNNVFWP